MRVHSLAQFTFGIYPKFNVKSKIQTYTHNLKMSTWTKYAKMSKV